MKASNELVLKIKPEKAAAGNCQLVWFNSSENVVCDGCAGLITGWPI
jgi:ribosomal protein S27E